MQAAEQQRANAGMLAQPTPAALIGSRMQQLAQQQQQGLRGRAAAKLQSGTTSGICGGSSLVIEIWSSSSRQMMTMRRCQMALQIQRQHAAATPTAEVWVWAWACLHATALQRCCVDAAAMAAGSAWLRLIMLHWLLLLVG
jgi:hypothetical protein